MAIFPAAHSGERPPECMREGFLREPGTLTPCPNHAGGIGRRHGLLGRGVRVDLNGSKSGPQLDLAQEFGDARRSVRSVARLGRSSATASDQPCLDERAQGRQDQPRPLHRAGDRPVQREATVGERRGPDASLSEVRAHLVDLPRADRRIPLDRPAIENRLGHRWEGAAQPPSRLCPSVRAAAPRAWCRRHPMVSAPWSPLARPHVPSAAPRYRQRRSPRKTRCDESPAGSRAGP